MEPHVYVWGVEQVQKLDAEKWGEFLPKKASAAFLKPYYC